MLEELERRNYSQNSVRTYLMTIEDFARYFHQSPDGLGPEHVTALPGLIEDLDHASAFEV
jgi:hypothetical protein